MEAETRRETEENLALIVRCQEGDPSSFETLFYVYRDDVFRFAYLVVRDSNQAQDVVQESFLKIYRSIERFQFRSSFRSWLYRIVVNEAVTLLRRKKLKEILGLGTEGELNEPVGREWQPEEAAIESEMRSTLKWAIAQLDPLHRSVVVLKYYHEFSDTEIAQVMGCPPGTVKSRLHRAKELIRHSVAVKLGQTDLIALSYARLSSTVLP